MIRIGDRVCLFDDDASRDDIIEDSYVQWNRRVDLGWREVPGQVTTVSEPLRSQSYNNVTPPGHAVGESMDSFYNIPSISFFSPDQQHELSINDLMYDSPWTIPLDTFLQEKPSELSVHEHARGCPYVVTFPKNCAFLRISSIPCMIKAYEAQKMIIKQIATQLRLLTNASLTRAWKLFHMIYQVLQAQLCRIATFATPFSM